LLSEREQKDRLDKAKAAKALGITVPQRENDSLPLKSAQRGFAELLKTAKRDGVEWVFIDTAPNLSASVTDAIRCATLAIIPCRPGVFDLDAVKETIGFASQVRVPYAGLGHLILCCSDNTRRKLIMALFLLGCSTN
jgi:cellulose biosynthesis protein BcsQ